MARPPALLIDTTEAGLIAAIEADQVASRTTDPEIPVGAHVDGDVAWGLAPLADTFRNVVLEARFSETDAGHRIGAISEAYRRTGTGFLWWVAPFDTPPDLGGRLTSAGLVLEGSAPAMAADLAAVALGIVPVTDAPPSVPSGGDRHRLARGTGREHTDAHRRTSGDDDCRQRAAPRSASGSPYSSLAT